MNRRNTLFVLLALFTAPRAPFAQQGGKVWRIGFLGVTNASGYVSELEAIRQRLRELGYTEGRNIVIEYRWGEGNPERVTKLAAELVAFKVDVMITHSIPGTRAAARATKTIPIVMADGAVERVPGQKVNVVDTTGAGDAFTCALGVALAEGQPLVDAVRFATYAGALACTKLSVIPALPFREEVEAMMGKRKT